MTKVQVWLLNEGEGWFRSWPAFEANASPDDTLMAVQEHVRLLLQGMKRRKGWSPPAVAYEVLREDG